LSHGSDIESSRGGRKHSVELRVDDVERERTGQELTQDPVVFAFPVREEDVPGMKREMMRSQETPPVVRWLSLPVRGEDRRPLWDDAPVYREQVRVVARGLRLRARMPPAQNILEGLSRIAARAVGISIAWHIATAVVAAALVLGLRPRKRVAAIALSAPLASVGLLAFWFDNPFNGAIFSFLALGLAGLAWRAPPGHVVFDTRWFGVLGCALIGFGLVYPHFLDGASWFTYLYAAPLGTIPCPTLSLVTGVALAAGGFGLGAWRLVLAAAGCFYALFGVLRLGVAIDTVLLGGALGLLAQHAKDRSSVSGASRILSRWSSPHGP
jgi:hypothetical protein